jgi:hypothetical protein
MQKILYAAFRFTAAAYVYGLHVSNCKTHLKDEAELAQPSLVWMNIVSEGLDTLKKLAS